MPRGSGPSCFPGARSPEEVDYGAGGLGARLWDASVGLSIWLCRNPARVRGRAVLELGSGVGLSGVSAALAGAAALTLSDTTATAGAFFLRSL